MQLTTATQTRQAAAPKRATATQNTGSATSAPSSGDSVTLTSGAREILYSRKDFNAPTNLQTTPGPRPTKGAKFQFTRADLAASTSNTSIASQLSQGDSRFTADGVDRIQGSKVYHDPNTLEPLEDGYKPVKHKQRVDMCFKENKKGDRCQNKLKTETQHAILSCVYKNEADGDLYRVLHRADTHTHADKMNKYVCGGHQLRKMDAWTVMPQQKTEGGDRLYVDPSDIVQVQSVTPEEASKYSK